ncbi:hypothetical protein PSQ40_04870 [Curvibacter sp. HBC61]|uniref:Uncharacterized protein n=1 Tax=Curvibacter cyanobacteriorum TaxID=3026422 RepID=A0ABT5MVQ4_9BURK|nr:hypothetical protein [Curvibacter sp. HBC61]MDD0837898.1 hypothetical protein [Curvibacter sp. HBC61]
MNHPHPDIFYNLQYADNFADDIAHRIGLAEEKLQDLAKLRPQSTPVYPAEATVEATEQCWTVLQAHKTLMMEILQAELAQHKEIKHLKLLQENPPPSIEDRYGFTVLEDNDGEFIIDIAQSPD